MGNAIETIFQLLILVFSVVVHEVSHGFAANALGDPTAKYAGRLTLNPLKHLDLFGSVIFPLLTFFAGGIVIGWAKPVPYNPYNLKTRNQEVGSAIVGAAGPASNILLAIVFGLAYRFSGFWAPLLGNAGAPIAGVFALIAFVNLALSVFNLVPIPPLDGSKVLFALFPYQWGNFRIFLERFGIIILLVFIFSFSGVILPIVQFLFRFITGV